MVSEWPTLRAPEGRYAQSWQMLMLRVLGVAISGLTRRYPSLYRALCFSTAITEPAAAIAPARPSRSPLPFGRYTRSTASVEPEQAACSSAARLISTGSRGFGGGGR